jgi:chromosome segregation protein
MAKLEAQAGDIEAELARAEAESGSGGKLQALNAGFADLSANVQRIEVELQAAEAEEEAALKAEAEARAAAAAAKLASQELETELATLLKLLAPAHDWSPIVEEISVTSGYEQALGAALGDDLDAASDANAPSHWRPTAPSGDDPDLPDGAIPLSKFVKGPEVLARRLRQIGVVEAAHGRKLQASLAPGQRLVSKDGDLWRWDGYSLKSGTDSAAGARLMERQRLNALRDEAAKAQARAREAEAEREAAASRAERASSHQALRQRQRRRMPSSTARDAIARLSTRRKPRARSSGAYRGASRTRAAFDEANARNARLPRRLSSSPRSRAWKPHSKRRKQAPTRAGRRPRSPTPRSKASSARSGSGKSGWRQSARKKDFGSSASPMRASRS